MNDIVKSVVELQRAGDFQGALRIAMERWRQCRLQVIAEAIDILSEEALKGFEAPVVRKNADFHRLWCERVREPDLVALGWLAANLTHKLPGNSAEEKSDSLLERFDAIAQIAADSRISGAITRLFDLDPPVLGIVPTREGGCSLLEDIGDERTWAAADQITIGLADSPLPDLDRAKKEAVGATQAERDAWAALAAGRNARAAARAEVLRSMESCPSDDESRAVIADRLIELGDPRGEFISLQLSEDAGQANEQTSARAQVLLEKHGEEWLGELRPAAYRAWFRRGFLWRLDLHASSRGGKNVAGLQSSVLSTVEELGGKPSPAIYVAFITSPKMTSLKTICVEADAILKAVEKDPPQQVTDVRSTGWSRTSYEKRFATRVLPLLESGAFPKLNSVGCTAAVYEGLAASPILAQLTAVEILGPLSDVLPHWAGLPSHIKRLQHRSAYPKQWAESVELRRGDGGTHVAICGESCAIMAQRVLAQLPSDTVEVVVELPLDADRYVAPRRGLDSEQFKDDAEKLGIAVCLLRQPSRSGRLTGL